jgi:hypothetical protein
MGDIRLFVSHAHKDKEIAMALVDTIEAAMVPEARILCTSHDKPQYREPDNVDISEVLRDHLVQSSCVLAVLTPNSLKSPWCLFELGGAWVRATQTYPLLAGGLSKEDLPAALKGNEAIQLTEPDEIRRLFTDLRQFLNWRIRNTGSADKEIDHLVKIVHGTTWT